MKFLKTTLLTLVATFALASCDTDDPEQTLQYTYSNDITYVTDISTNTSVALDGAKYVIDFDLVNGKADIEISNLRLSPLASAMTLKIEQATYRQDSETGAIVVTVPNATSVIGGSSHNIGNFKLSQSLYYIESLGQTAVYYSISYTVDGQYNVVAVQRSSFLPGTTAITSNADGSSVGNSKRTYYSYSLNREKSTATVSVYSLDYNGKYYTELAFEDLPYTLSSSGININYEGDITAKQSVSAATPFVAKAISLDSRYDSSTQIRILTDENLITASLSFRPQSTTD